jgi:DnaK suppressor protein
VRPGAARATLETLQLAVDAHAHSRAEAALPRFVGPARLTGAGAPPEECVMATVSYVPTDRDVRAGRLHRDTVERLHALLLASRDDEAARLAQLRFEQDPAAVDEHTEISAALTGETLDDIEHALSRLDAGTYGTCEFCGQAIPFERLEAIPHASTCVACAVAR